MVPPIQFGGVYKLSFEGPLRESYEYRDERGRQNAFVRAAMEEIACDNLSLFADEKHQIKFKPRLGYGTTYGDVYVLTNDKYGQDSGKTYTNEDLDTLAADGKVGQVVVSNFMPSAVKVTPPST